MQDLNRNTTMLLGIASGQELSIKEVKIGLVAIRERLDIIERRLDRLETKSDEHTTLLTQLVTTLNEHGMLLTQVLARLPKP